MITVTRWRAILAVLAVLITTGAYAILTVSAAQARTGLKIGVTMKVEEYGSEFARFEDAGYQIDVTRVFSSSSPPPWSDTRIQELKARGIVPFISWKTHDPTAVRNWLLAMPSDIPMVYLAEFHEAEADLAPTTYKNRQIATWNAINSLPANIRAKVKFGPIQTKQWTENTAGRSYATYDPGIGDFWGVDAYMNSWVSDYPDPDQWLAQIKAYNTNGRPKWLPELGAVSLPHDTATGPYGCADCGRALFIDRIVKRLEALTYFGLVIWWQTEGTAGSHLNGLCTRRNFRLHQRTTCSTSPPSAPVYTTVTPVPNESLRVYRDFMNRNTP